VRLGKVRDMKQLVVLFVALAAVGCEKQASVLDSSGKAVEGKGGGAGGGADSGLRALEQRVAALEAGSKVQFAPDGKTDMPLAERMHRVEATIARYNEALEFLGKVYAQQKAQMEQQEANEPDPDAVFAVDVSGAVKAGQSEGPNSATVTIIKAFDFACPYCQQLTEPLHQLVKEYNGKVRVVYMNLVVHPDTAQLAHVYSCAAAKQQKYVAFKDAFWEKGFNAYKASGGKDRSTMGEDNILKLSGELGLDVQKLKADANSADCKQRIAADMQELQKFKVNGTPGLFINGKFFGGAISKPQFEAVINEKLKIAEASGVGGGEYYEKEIMGKGSRTFRSKRDAKGGAAHGAPGQDHTGHAHP
jgi:protein-disulfide isomerase